MSWSRSSSASSTTSRSSRSSVRSGTSGQGEPIDGYATLMGTLMGQLGSADPEMYPRYTGIMRSFSVLYYYHGEICSPDTAHNRYTFVTPLNLCAYRLWWIEKDLRESTIPLSIKKQCTKVRLLFSHWYETQRTHFLTLWPGEHMMWSNGLIKPCVDPHKLSGIRKILLRPGHREGLTQLLGRVMVLYDKVMGLVTINETSFYRLFQELSRRLATLETRYPSEVLRSGEPELLHTCETVNKIFHDWSIEALNSHDKFKPMINHNRN